jgi:Lanthionine synthetase C-like protein
VTGQPICCHRGMVATTVLAMPRGEAAESLALGALDWLLSFARSTKEGLTWAATVPGTEANFTLYHGSAGIVLALLEAQQHFGDDRYGDAAMRGAAAIAAAADHEENCSLYFGLAGMAVALHAVHVQLGGSSTDAAARRALDQVRSRFDGQRWGVMFELLGGNAGIAVGALQAGDPELAVLAVEPYLRAADPTPGGVNVAISGQPFELTWPESKKQARHVPDLFWGPRMIPFIDITDDYERSVA